jgi:hypothetical protein
MNPSEKEAPNSQKMFTTLSSQVSHRRGGGGLPIAWGEHDKVVSGRETESLITFPGMGDLTTG